MTDLVWNKELTEFALSNLEHRSWAVINPNDMLRTIDKIQQGGGLLRSSAIEQIRDELQVKNYDFLKILEYLELITADSDEFWKITDKPSRSGFYSGKELVSVIKAVGVESPQALNVLGHNFILHARESLPFCCLLRDPGAPKDNLKGELVDSYIFNQKLNLFKFDNLINNLIQFQVIKETKIGFVVKYSPPDLTFYHLASCYFFLASNIVGRKVNAGDLQREVHNLLPNRDENYNVLGFDQFPIEGWGKHQAWMTPKSFTRLLQVGLIDPLCVARVLKTIARDAENPSQDLAQSTLIKLKNKILKDVRIFKGDPINLSEVLREFDV